MIYLGIDPGYGRMGYGLVELKGNRPRALDYGVLETRSGQAMELRLEQVYDKVLKLATGRRKITEAGVEQLYFSKNVRTAMAVAQARGVILLALKKRGVSVVDVSPQHVKSALVGHGAATKKQIQGMVQRLLNLDKIPQPDDAADGLGLALTVMRTRGARQWQVKAAAARKGGKDQ